MVERDTEKANRECIKQLQLTEIAAHSDAAICEAGDARYVDDATVLRPLQEGQQSFGHVELKSAWLIIEFHYQLLFVQITNPK